MSTYDNEYKKEVAMTINAQMGGHLNSMVGATQMTYGEMEYDGFVQPYFQFKFKMNPKIKFCRVIYKAGMDTYAMQFLNNKGDIVKEYAEAYCDDLIPFFEETTGLVLTLF